MKKYLLIILTCMCILACTGCSKSSRVNWNLRQDANNFEIRRRVVALNTRTNEALFTVEGFISLDTDSDGDLNVTIRTGKDDYKLFYAHLSDDVTYTCIQLDDAHTDEYAYQIKFFPAKEVLEHGLINIDTTD